MSPGPKKQPLLATPRCFCRIFGLRPWAPPWTGKGNFSLTKIGETKKTSNVHQIFFKYIVDYVKRYVKLRFFLEKMGHLDLNIMKQVFHVFCAEAVFLGWQGKKTAAWDQGAAERANFFAARPADLQIQKQEAPANGSAYPPVILQ